MIASLPFMGGRTAKRSAGMCGDNHRAPVEARHSPTRPPLRGGHPPHEGGLWAAQPVKGMDADDLGSMKSWLVILIGLMKAPPITGW